MTRETPPLNPLLAAVAPPPIADAQGWVRGMSPVPGRPLVDLCQAVPGHPPAAELVEHLAERLHDPAVHRYTDILGLPALREALAGDIGRVYGARPSPSHVAITAGCNQAFCAAMMSLAHAGDEVILPLPHYFNHKMWLDALGIHAVPLPFRADAGGVPDPGEAADRIGPKTRAIVLVTPNNPTGAVYPPEVIAEFYELARTRGIALVLDETYRDFLPEDRRPHDLFADPAWPETLVHLYSFSKVFAITGHRVGALVAGPRLMASVEKALDCIAICAPRLGQEAALFGIQHLREWVTGNTLLMRSRAAAFRVAMESLPGWRLVSIGAYFAYVAHPFDGRPAYDVAKALAERQSLLTLPGSMFGSGQDRYLRLAFANVAGETAATVAARLAAFSDQT